MKTSLSIKNYLLEFTYKLLDMPLHGKELIARNKFVKILADKMRELEIGRIDLIKEYAKKDKDGKPKIKKESNEFDLSEENLTKFQVEYTNLLKSEAIIDILDSNREEIKIVGDIILNSKREFGIQEGEQYLEICESFR